jgi:hypothetical protein
MGIERLTNKPEKTLVASAQVNDVDNPNSKTPREVEARPIKMTGLRPIRSDSDPHGKPIRGIVLLHLLFCLTVFWYT